MVAYLALKISRIFSINVSDSKRRDSDNDVVVYKSVEGCFAGPAFAGDKHKRRSMKMLLLRVFRQVLCNIFYSNQETRSWVDDKPGIIRFVQINPAPAGYEVISIIYREEALPPVRSEKQDNTLLDILMPPKASPSFACRWSSLSYSLPRLPFFCLALPSDNASDPGRSVKSSIASTIFCVVPVPS